MLKPSDLRALSRPVAARPRRHGELGNVQRIPEPPRRPARPASDRRVGLGKVHHPRRGVNRTHATEPPASKRRRQQRQPARQRTLHQQLRARRVGSALRCGRRTGPCLPTSETGNMERRHAALRGRLPLRRARRIRTATPRAGQPARHLLPEVEHRGPRGAQEVLRGGARRLRTARFRGVRHERGRYVKVQQGLQGDGPRLEGSCQFRGAPVRSAAHQQPEDAHPAAQNAGGQRHRLARRPVPQVHARHTPHARASRRGRRAVPRALASARGCGGSAQADGVPGAAARTRRDARPGTGAVCWTRSTRSPTRQPSSFWSSSSRRGRAERMRSSRTLPRPKPSRASPSRRTTAPWRC